MTRITQQQLESYLWGAAVLLRGTIDAGDYKQFIFPLLFFKRLCDVFDEETLTALRESGGDQDFALFPENHRFQVPADAHWREIRKVNREVGYTLQQAMRAIEVENQDKLMGIFGDAQWTNKDRLADAMLRDLIEHFSTLELTVANLPEDELGQGYEYLIKKFADDSGHTAAEFYTNRTVVHLMTEMLDVQPGESVYDPTCGSGGMLLSCITHLRRAGKEWRNVKLYGQERNLMTSSIARMNCFLHGIEDFRIERGDTLAEPKLVEGDHLRRFDVVLANPPYSIKQWNREAFAADPWGRNVFGVPPQGRADYAFQQHILQSLKAKTGRCAVLWPHGVLFRKEEAEIRRKLIEADLIECVLGLGPNLFYNSPMEACVVICRTQKPKARRGKILFINAVNEVTRERAQSFLTDEHLQRIVRAYQDFKAEPGFTHVATLEEVRSKDGNLSIPLYVETATQAQREEAAGAATTALPEALAGWLHSALEVRSALSALDKSVAQPSITVADDLTANPAWATLPLFDRRTWKRVRFGEVVENCNETCDPEESRLERFVAMEHLEPGSLYVRSWGNVADGTTFTRRCQPGQVLFGKRRAYQRKVAVAEFEAVVSGDIYVLAPKDSQRLLPELLPFLCLSERFFQHAVGTSAGSLSPRTNWSSLASFEFDLPPLDQQRRIAEILWAVDAVASATTEVFTSADSYRNVFLRDAFDNLNHRQLRFRTVQDLIDAGVIEPPQDGNHGELHPTAKDYVPEGIPFVMANDIRDGRLALNTCKRIPEAVARKLRIGFAKPGDILLSHKGSIGLTTIVPDTVGDFIMLTPQVTYYRVKDSKRLRPKFLLAVLNSEQFQRVFQVRAKQSTRDYIGILAQRELPVSIPDVAEQDLILENLEKIEVAVRALKLQLACDTELFTKSINTVC
jgi:type I restriction enzyme M protein